MNIYIVHAATKYEGSSPICGYFDKADAEAFAQRCTEYHATRGDRLGRVMDAINSKDDDELDRLIADDDEWISKHPAGQAGNMADTFEVHPLPLKPGLVNGEIAWATFVQALEPGQRSNVLDSMRRGESLTRLAFEAGAAPEREQP